MAIEQPSAGPPRLVFTVWPAPSSRPGIIVTGQPSLCLLGLFPPWVTSLRHSSSLCLGRWAKADVSHPSSRRWLRVGWSRPRLGVPILRRSGSHRWSQSAYIRRLVMSSRSCGARAAIVNAHDSSRTGSVIARVPSLRHSSSLCWHARSRGRSAACMGVSSLRSSSSRCWRKPVVTFELVRHLSRACGARAALAG